MEEKSRGSARFILLLLLYCFIIAAGSLYAILFLKGTIPWQENIPADNEPFRVLVQILPEDGEEDGITAKIEYDPAYQKLIITSDNGQPEEQGVHYLRVSEENFRRIIDKSGGISLTGADGYPVVLDGQKAYEYALGGGTGNPSKDQAVIFSAFLDTLRLHAHDEVFSLKLLAFAFPKTETDISLKEASAVGKSMLKADSIETEIRIG